MFVRVLLGIAAAVTALEAQCPNPPPFIGSASAPISVAAALSPTCMSAYRPGSFAYRATFFGTAGQRIAIDITVALGGDGFPQFDSYIYLLGTGFTVIAEDDDGEGGTDSRIPPSPMTLASTPQTGTFQLPSTGTYTIEVTTFDPNVTGQFTLRITSPAHCTPAAITVGQTVNGTLGAGDCFSPTGGRSNADRYTFSGTAGQQVLIELSSTAFDSYVYLLRADETIVATDDDSGGVPNARIPSTGLLTLSSAGTYIIEVASFDGIQGAYTLRLTAGAPTPPVVTSIAPYVGSGQQQTFTLVYSDPGGWQDLANVYVLFNVPNTTPNSCYVEFNRAGGSLRLLQNDGVTWIGPSVVLSGGPLTNSQCTINAALSSFSGSGNNLTVNLSVTFAAGFTGEKNVYMQAIDNGGLTSDRLLLGSWWPNTTTSQAVNRYRMYNPFSLSHLHTTDLNEYNVLATLGFVQEGIGSRIFTGPATAGSVTAVPLYRLYSITGVRHFWTSDRNEYVTLSRFTNLYSGEGADGFILPVASGNAIPLFRLRFATANPPIHHWTADAYENSVLVGSGGWIAEPGPGYVFPPTGPVVLNGLAPSKSESSMQALMAAGTATEPVVLAVVNGASHEETPVSPGSVVRIRGRGLNSVQSVRFEAVPAQIISSAENELTVVVPEQVSGKTQALLQIDGPAGRSMQRMLDVAPVDPGIFATDYSGRGRVEMRNEDGTVDHTKQPAERGSQISFDVTGVDADHAGELKALVGGYPAEVISARPSNENPGRITVTIRVPEDVSPAKAVPLEVHVGPSYSQRGVVMAVK